MASIRKKSTSPYWFACYYREDGSRTQTSTKTRDRNLAQKIADDLEQAHKGRATEGQMREILSSLNERIAGQPLASATLDSFASQWLARKATEIEAVSYLAYKTAVNEFVAVTPKKQNLGINYVTAADVAAYRDRSAAVASPKTANNKLKILRTMFQSAWRDGFVQENPAAKVPILKSAESSRRAFTLRDVQGVRPRGRHADRRGSVAVISGETGASRDRPPTRSAALRGGGAILGRER